MERPMPFLKTVMVLGVLTALGYLGNVASLPVAFSVSFLFGSIFVIIAVSLLGPWLGGLSALIASSYTYILWNHPYAIVIFVCEALWIGFCLKRKHTNIVLIDVVYWMVIGLPLVFIFYFGVMSLGFQSTTIIFLKQSINGIVNALIAGILISHLPFQKWFRLPWNRRMLPYSRIVFQLTSAFLMLPLVGMLLFTNYQESKTIQTVVKDLVVSETEMVSDLIHSWLLRHMAAVKSIAKLGRDHHFQPSEKLQADLKKINSLFPDIHAVYIADPAATTIAFIPTVNERGELTIGTNFVDREYYKQLKATLKPVVSDVFQGRGGVFRPIFTISVPIVERGRLSGFGLGALNLDNMRKVLLQNTRAGKRIFTIVDQNENVVCSTNPKNIPLTRIKQKTGGQSLMLGKDVGLWTPSTQRNISIMNIWKDATYFASFPIAGTSWTLLTEFPVGPLQGYFYHATIVNLLLIFSLFAIAIILSQILSKLLARTPVRLAAISRDIPEKLAKNEEVTWPESNIAEMHLLIKNFKETTQALSLEYQNVKDMNVHLEKRVRERTAELRESEEKFRFLTENMADIVWTLDMDFKTTYVSPSVEKVLGFTPEERKRQPLEKMIPPESLQRAQRMVLEELQKDQEDTADPDRSITAEVEYYHKDGSTVWMENHLKGLRDKTGAIIGMYGASRNISDRKRAEEALRESDDRHTAMIANIGDVIGIMGSDGIMKYKSPNIERWFGWKPEDLVGTDGWETVHSEDIERIQKEFNALLEKDKASTTIEYRLKCKDGSYKWIELTAVNCVNDPAINGVLLNYHDVTARKQAEQKLKTSEKQFRQISENTPAIVYQFKMSHDKSFSFPYVSEKILGLMGVSAQEVMRDASNLINLVHPEDLEMFVENVMISASNLTPYHDIFRCVKGETTVWVECRTTPTPMADGSILWDGFFLDISERKQAEEKIKSSLKEKEILLSEIHHRVKNNMQVISSLLKLQSAKIEDKKYVDMFKDSENRIKAMSLIHETLYQSKDFANIDFTDYVKNLTRQLVRSYALNPNKIRLTIDAEDISLGLDHAIPCGLIINEIISNSLKYAFPKDREGEIRIVLQTINSHELELTVSDDGIGILEEIDMEKTESLGLQRVHILAELHELNNEAL